MTKHQALPGATLPAGNLLLLDSFEPPLKDGTYSIDVAQTLSAPGAAIASIAQQFTVSGPRFALPPSEIRAEFPPSGSSGAFAQVLPHVVLNTRLLPWERDVAGLPDTVPWLALMIFAEGELVGTGSGLQTMTVDALINQQPATVRVPALSGLTADELAMHCTVITLSGSDFAALVPTGRELPYLAHARLVDMTGKVLAAAANEGTFSIVAANRFPLAGGPVYGQRCIAHLVSLEGFGDLLSGVTPTAPTQAQVMLVSLYSWTFSCLAEPTQTFAGLAANLALTGPNVPRQAASLLLQLPYTSTGSSDAATVAAEERLSSGYVALGYHAPTGEDGFAWYRGPFCPVVPNAIAPAGSFASADAAMIYDPVNGIFDHSLAAAWQCGQTLALADQTYATTLMRLRQRVNAELDRMAAQATASPLPRHQLMQQRLGALVGRGIVRQIGDASQGRVGLRSAASSRSSLRRPSASVRDLKESLARQEVRDALTRAVPNDPDAIAVADWLGQLQLLCGVPFVHLVPDARMLPPEAIRFFFVDPSWIATLTAGALNIGIGSGRGLVIQALLTVLLEAMAEAAALGARAELTGQSPPAPPTGPTGGLLIRSALISGWPGLSVSGTSGGTPIPILRLDHLAPDVMLCLFNGVPDQVVLEQPHEGLEFGVDDNGCSEVRIVEGSSISTAEGPMIYDPATPEQALVTIRNGGRRVLNLNSDPAFPTAAAPATPVDLLGTLARALDIGTLAAGPAVFALQMMKGPETVTFCLDPPVDRTASTRRPIR